MSSLSQVGSPSSASQDKNITDELAEYAMTGRWDDVVRMYQTHGAVAHKAILNKAGDTALRVAISAGQTDVAKQLVDAAANTDGALELRNRRGNTVLHIAAYVGDGGLCSHIAGKNPELVGKRNWGKETPLFYAVHFGHLEAFLTLHGKCGRDLGYDYGRRGDGETILHTAISRRYYEMAYRIIKLYPKLVYAMNEKGFSPLYLMASTPSAFRSGCPQIRGIHQLIYYCIYVSKLKMQAGDEDKRERQEKQQTCIGYVSSPWNRIKAFMGCSTNPHCQSKDEEGQHADHTRGQGEQGSDVSENDSQGSNMLISTIGSSLQCLTRAMSVIFGPGIYSPKKLKETKRNNVWSEQIMKELVNGLSKFRYEHNGMSPGLDADAKKWFVEIVSSDQNQPSPFKDIVITSVDNSGDTNRNKEEMMKTNEAKRKEKEALASIAKMETPILVAAKNGVIEIVREVVDTFYIAIHDSNIENKNAVLLAAENRRANVYDFLLNKGLMKERLFGQRDKDGNSVLHLAAKLSDGAEPWHVPGPALQMQCEVKWYEFVKSSMGPHFFQWFNDADETPDDLFKATHTNVVRDGGEWLNRTSNSFSIVATLVATVAFATSAIVPGGVSDSGNPVLENRPAFSIFAISSLIALCFSIICVIMFLAILTSRYQDVDFGKDLPRKFLIGLTSLFVSITSMLISFCAGHSFVLKEELKYAALPVYAITCLAVTVVTIAQFPFYFDLVMITFSKKPWSHKN